MKFEVESLKEYSLIKREKIEELNSECYLLCHNKTKARVAVMANDDKNKVFSIGFRTPVADDTGVAHIVEHTVLCGSKKYPLRDPFVELVKGSMNTFLNAMTFPDKTIYPVASCNDKDFQNLMDVYLDAVLNPRIYEKKEIFAKEGWHYTIDDEGNMDVNGIVYNEMKGAFSKPEEIIMSKAMAHLFPTTNYGFESGGDPVHIPELKYEDYLDFHRRYYHPSNSFIFLYGDMDFNEKLQYINDEYLKDFDYMEIDSTIKVEEPFNEAVYSKEYYPVSDGENAENKDYLGYIVTAGGGTDKLLYYAMKVLDYTLVSMPGAPVKQALIDAGIGEDVFGGEQNLKQRFFMIISKYANAADVDKFRDVVENTLRDIVKNGIDKDSLKAALNILEFNYREGDFGSYPKGIFYLIDSFESWLYDDNEAFLHLKAGETFKYLNEMVETDYFEKIIEKYLLDNTHKVLLTLEAKPGLGAANDKERKEKLEQYKKTLSAEEIEDIKALEKAIEDYVNTEDSEENLKKIPVLELEDLDKEAEKTVIEEISDVNGKEFKGEKLLYSDIRTNGIAYLTVSFNIRTVKSEDLPYVGLLKSLVCNIDTKKHKYTELNNLVNMNTGGLSNDISGYIKENNDKNYSFYFDTSVKTFYDNMQFSFDIIKEVLMESKFDDLKRLKEVIAETKSSLEESILGSGHSKAIARAMSHYSEASYFSEKMSGISFYMFIKDLHENFEEKKKEVATRLFEVSKKIFTKENLLIHATLEKEVVSQYVNAVENFVCDFSDEKADSADRVFTKAKVYEGIKTPSSVQFVCRSGSYKSEGFLYNGAYRVLSNILAYGYLWENIREKGGAYGCMYRPTRTGKISLVSYRDPKLAETNEVYSNLPGYLRDFEASDRQMLKYIIGAISSIDTPKPPRAKGSTALSVYMTELPFEKVQQERDEILAATSEDIRKLAPAFEAALSDDCICVIGNSDKIEENKEMFTSIIEVIK